MPPLSELYGLPLSSPLQSENSSPIPRTNTITIREDSPSPSPAQGTPTPTQLKRRAEDMTQFASEVSRAHKLVKADHDQLQTFSKYDQPEQLIFLAGSVLALTHHQQKLQPADTLIVLPKKIQNKVLEQAGIVMLDPSVPAYRDDKIGPVKLVMDLFDDNGASWGFTDAIKKDPDQIKALKDEIGGVFINKRHGVKALILGSLGSAPAEGQTLRPDAVNVVDLANQLATHQKVRAKVDVAFCGRVALLRKIATESEGNKYWISVDSELVRLRQEYPDPTQMSKFIKKRVLDEDMKSYGAVELPGLGSRRRRPKSPNKTSTGSAPART